MPANLRTPIALATFALAVVGCAGNSAAPSSTTRDTRPPAPTTSLSAVATTSEPIATTAAATGVAISVTGVVIDVVGGLAGVDSFTLRLPNGSDLVLAPAEDLLFDDVAPISHLRDHLISGAPVTATYLQADQGVPVVVAVGDAEGGHSDDD